MFEDFTKDCEALTLDLLHSAECHCLSQFVDFDVDYREFAYTIGK